MFHFLRCLFVCQVLFTTLEYVFVGAQDTKLLIFLNNSLNSELYGDFAIVNQSSTVEVEVASTNKNISFIIFQVHSHLYNITLYQDVISVNSSINGTNLGLFSTLTSKRPIFFIYNANEVDVYIYISVHGYGSKDPIPGDCNMEFSISTAPFLKVGYTPNYISVEAAPARYYNDIKCVNMSVLYYEYYRLYLPVRDFSAATYFEGIKRMLTYDKIIENGDLVPFYEDFPYMHMKRMFGNYPGTASIYAVVVKDINNRVSIYVPSHTYGCSPLDENDSCALLDDRFSQVLCAILLFTGIFLCYFGHRFFKTEMFLMGLASGVIVTYFLISVITEMDRPSILGACLLSGIFFGAIWWIFWWFYSIPLYALLIPSLNVAFLFTSIIYFVLGDGNFIFTNNYNYWVIFVSLLLVITLALMSVTYTANLLCCAILGSFAIMYPIDFYLGSNLKYIVINIIRRASVAKFNVVTLTPPYQWQEALLTTSWIALALTGFLFQHYLNRGKPPFPPPPRSARSVPTDLGAYGTFTPEQRYRESRPQRQRLNDGITETEERALLLP